MEIVGVHIRRKLILLTPCCCLRQLHRNKGSGDSIVQVDASSGGAESHYVGAVDKSGTLNVENVEGDVDSVDHERSTEDRDGGTRRSVGMRCVDFSSWGFDWITFWFLWESFIIIVCG